MTVKEVSIVGRGPSWKECPFVTEELWGASTCLLEPVLADKRYTKVFAFDNDPITMESIKVAKERNIAIVSKLDYATERYPVWEVVREFTSSYLKPTISYMLAYALYSKYTHLHIYGIDQGPQWYVQQGKPYVMFWLGVATGRGVKYRIGRGSLKWAYSSLIDDLPKVVLEDEPDLLYNHIGERALECAAEKK